MPWTSAASGFAPLVLPKLTRVVKVCPCDAVVAVTQTKNTAQAAIRRERWTRIGFSLTSSARGMSQSGRKQICYRSVHPFGCAAALLDDKILVARKRACCSGDYHRAGGRAERYDCCEERVGKDVDIVGGHSVEGDAGGAGQSLAKDLCGAADLAAVTNQRHKGRESHV